MKRWLKVALAVLVLAGSYPLLPSPPAPSAAAHDGPYAHNNNDALIAKLTEELQDEPDDKKLLRDRGYAYLQQDEYESALADFEHLLRLDPRYEGGHVGRAWVYLKESDLKAALADLDPLCDGGTALAGAWFVRGEVRHELGDQKGALADLDHALGLTKKYTHGYVVRSRVRAALGDQKGALDELGTADQVDPRNREAHLERALLRVASDWNGAKADLEVVTDDPTAADDSSVLATQARLLYRNNGMITELYAKALAAFERDVKFVRSNQKKAALLVDEARLRSELGDGGPALKLIDSALVLAPERLDAHRLKLRLLEHADKVEPAVLESARKRLAEIEAAHGVASVGSGR
jgi:tetratricopeptide (TPR) repeat protein